MTYKHRTTRDLEFWIGGQVTLTQAGTRIAFVGEPIPGANPSHRLARAADGRMAYVNPEDFERILP